MKKIRLLILSIMMLISSAWTATHVKADIGNISVTPIINDSDVTDRFQIVAQPNKVYQMRLSLTNFSDMSTRVRVRPTNASTTSQGGITYQKVVNSGDNDLRYAFKDMTASKVVKLGANKTKEVAFDVHMPARSFKGLMLGGFYIYDLNTPNAPGLKVPVWITEDNKPVGGVLVLNGVTPEAVNHKPFINVNLSNNQPGLMKNVTVHMSLKRRGLLELFGMGFKPVTADQVYKQIAPNSNIPIAFDQQSLPVKPGIYQATGTARSGKTHWKFSGSYRITQKQANAVNRASRGLNPDKTVMYLMIVLGLLLLIGFVFGGLWSQSRKQKQQQQEQSNPPRS
ncbi:DUF916 and DUF3324 domain-containing protein [Bombilactobacillus folatiphilus]|uniref:DUF916 and DUF3324 domain-containing protein n=1 Tax=Bombilactobacillus folatiphilus TaxID=2923362 RepID=A0ABY4P830_9LACO|nr:DUF916 domain-containing protein [Bombilactobacillus folatiphilus]UQS81858.1 DUF916 and DUF3324 domain-containing protein [Bombilactobacillus folatiphilus]